MMKLLSGALWELSHRRSTYSRVSIRRFTQPVNREYVRIFFGRKVMSDAGLQSAKRLDAKLENGRLVFFEPSLPGGGWAVIRPGRSQTLYLHIPYVDGVPFSALDRDRHDLKIIEIDSTEHTLSVSTVLSDGDLPADENE